MWQGMQRGDMVVGCREEIWQGMQRGDIVMGYRAVGYGEQTPEDYRRAGVVAGPLLRPCLPKHLILYIIKDNKLYSSVLCFTGFGVIGSHRVAVRQAPGKHAVVADFKIVE